jgi:hypothetical protein
VFDNLYISEGSYIAVSDDLENTPDHKEVVGPGEVTFSRIGTAEAEDDLGTVVGRLSGTTVCHANISQATDILIGRSSSSSTIRQDQVILFSLELPFFEVPTDSCL